MVEPLLEAHTEWVDKEDGNEEGRALKWTCPECEVDTFTDRRYATKRCRKCDKIMQSANYDVDPEKPDPENPESVLRADAKRKGLPADYFLPDDEPEVEDPLEW
jgi:ribosomal protein L37AE/L43A